MIGLNLILLIGFCVLLIKAVEILTESLQQVSRLTGVGRLAVSFLLMAAATSLPELVVSVTAALKEIQRWRWGRCWDRILRIFLW